ncbi:unnamed protein product [Paramecium octaurelia]|uniref:Uncharacterized protein n=1 Tax=Paramecium octaurelia TaxID=43137 RepID=A0A8S1YBD6_PAROT|nr:unnamed protein product [Paramecium octaurelia]
MIQDFQQLILLGLEPNQKQTRSHYWCSLLSIRRAHQQICNSYQISQNNRNYRSCFRYYSTIYELQTHDHSNCYILGNYKIYKLKLVEYQISSVIFIGINTAESLCQQIDQIIDKSKGESVNLTNTEIFKNLEMVYYETYEFDQIWRLLQKIFCIQKLQMGQYFKEIINCCYALVQFAQLLLEVTMKEFERNVLKRIDYLIANDLTQAFQTNFKLKNDCFKYIKILQIFSTFKVTKEINLLNRLKKMKKKCKYCGQKILVLINSLCWRNKLWQRSLKQLKIEHKTVFLQQNKKFKIKLRLSQLYNFVKVLNHIYLWQFIHFQILRLQKKSKGGLRLLKVIQIHKYFPQKWFAVLNNLKFLKKNTSNFIKLFHYLFIRQKDLDQLSNFRIALQIKFIISLNNP